MANTVADPQDVEMFIGVARTWTVTMSPVVDTSGWTVTFYLRRADDAVGYLITKSCSVSGITGQVSCTVDRADTVNLAEDTYAYSFVRSNSGSEDVIAYGACDLVYPKT